MALEIKLSQKLTQSLVMTPQLQQAIKLLQLGRDEYLEVIERELMENPVLEEIAPSSESSEHVEFSSLNRPSLSNSSLEREKNSDSSETEFFIAGEDSGHDIKASQSLVSFADTMSSLSSHSVRREVDTSRPSVESIVSTPEGLTSHLLWQLRTTELTREEEVIAELILGNLDINGYLCASIDELALESGRSSEEVLRVLSLVQTLDPSGIAARDLRECLLIQLEHLGLTNSLAWKIVDRDLSELEKHKYDVIVRKEGVKIEQVYEAVRQIQELEPRPGRPFGNETPVYITPDVYVKKVGDEYAVTLNDNGIPCIKLSKQYQDMMGAMSGDSADREYIQECIRSASWLIKSIEQRQNTILKVTESIMRFQRRFLEHGISELKPLVLRDVATDVNMHESTISRVTTDKYVHTPQGIFELKFFFTSSLSSQEGEISSMSVKQLIKDLVDKENQKKPLSDQDIADKLKEQGVDIARRTVAKYREMINILPSSHRKRMF